MTDGCEPMKLYLTVAIIAALCVPLPWVLHHQVVQGAGRCEVLVWLWLLWGACLGWIAKVALTTSSVGAPKAPMWMLAMGALGSSAASLIPPTLGAVPALGALYWAVAGTFASERTVLLARAAHEGPMTGTTWSLAADEPTL